MTLPSAPADTAIVAALANSLCPCVKNPGAASAIDHPDLFKPDRVDFAGRARVGDIVVANTAHVQIVAPAA